MSQLIDVPKLIEAPTTIEARFVTMASSAGGAGERFGIAVRGARFVVPLPRGYSVHSQVCDFFGAVIVVHEGLPPLLIDGERGRAIEVDFAKLRQDAQRARLLGLH